MKKIYIYLGENVCDLRFQQGCAPEGFNDGVYTFSCGITYRHLPEVGKHPRKYAAYLRKEIHQSAKYWDVHITTNSMDTLNILGDMIRDGEISSDAIKINVLSEDNKEIDRISTFDNEGYLENWPIGFLSWC